VKSSLFVLLLLPSLLAAPTLVYATNLTGMTAQLQQQQQQPPATGGVTADGLPREGLQEYTSTTDQISFSYPSGWVFDNLTQYSQSLKDAAEADIGYGNLGMLCPETSVIPSLGGGDSCEAALSQQTGLATETTPQVIIFLRFKDLDTKIAQELGLSLTQRQQQMNLTTDDAFAYYIEKILGDDPETRFVDESSPVKELVSSTPMTVDIVRAGTNGQVIGQAPGALVEYVYGSTENIVARDTRAYQVFALNEDTAVTFGI
jgi:hypothetical protein